MPVRVLVVENTTRMDGTEQRRSGRTYGLRPAAAAAAAAATARDLDKTAQRDPPSVIYAEKARIYSHGGAQAVQPELLKWFPAV